MVFKNSRKIDSHKPTDELNHTIEHASIFKTSEFSRKT